MAQNPHTTDTDTAPNGGRKTRLSCHNYVRSIAAVTAAMATGGVAGTAAADEEYEVIPAEGQTITVADGETWANKLIDLTTGGDIIIVADGTDWTIRNIGFKGKNTSIDAGANGKGTTVTVRDTDYDEQAGIAEHAGSTVQLGDNLGTNPEAVIPDGVPTSAEEAASGTGD